jgi:DNA-binding MurR/RpiR family transcriptional regulator
MTAALSPPRDFTALKALIAQRAAALPKRLTQIAAYALENPDEIAFGTVSSIAEQAQVQPSAPGALRPSLGYQGFSECRRCSAPASATAS